MIEYLTCSLAPPHPSEDSNHEDHSQRCDSPPPTLVESSCSESSELSRDSNGTITAPPVPLFPKAGDTSPSTLLGRRKLSTCIATTHNAHAKHPSLKGRPTFVVPRIHNNESTTPTQKKMAILPRSEPCRAPRSGPPRSNRTKERSHTVSSQRAAVAPLPTADLPKPRRLLHRAQSAPAEHDIESRFRNDPAPLRLEAWSEAAAENFKIRGPTYLKDRIKQPSQASGFRLLTADLINCEQPIYGGMCAHPTQRVQQAMKRERATGVKELPPFIFAVNLCLPGVQTYHQVSYFAIDNMDEIEQGKTPFGRLMKKFIFGDSDEFRNNTFKLIPRIVEGNFVVRKAVGTKPSILGKKIKQYYIRGDRYFEMIVDIASDPVAQRIVKLVLGYTKSMVVDMMFLLEGTDDETLPERMFGGIRMKNIDFRGKDGKRTVQSS